MFKILKKQKYTQLIKKKYQMQLLHWHPVKFGLFKSLRKDAIFCAFFTDAGSRFHVRDIINKNEPWSNLPFILRALFHVYPTISKIVGGFRGFK